MSRGRPTLAASTGLAILMALFLLSGRWNLSRVFSVDGSVLTAPRVWLVALVAFVAMLPLPRHRVVPPIGMCIFAGYFLLSALWAPDAALAAYKAVDLSVMALGIVCLRRLLVRAGVVSTTRALWRVIAIVFGTFAAIGLMRSVLGGGGRLSVLGGGPNVYGRNMGLLLLVCLAMVLDRGRARAWPLVGLVVAGLLVVLTGSRGALFGTLVGVAGLLFMRRVEVGRTVMAFVAGGLGLGVLVTYTAVGQAALAAFRARVVVLTFEQNYDSGRAPMRQAAFEMIERSPWVGDGLNGFRARGHGVYPHNLELEALTDGGWVGLVALGAVLAIPLLSVVMRSARVDPTTAAVFLLHLACAQVSGDFYDSRGVFLMGMLLSLQFTWRPRAPAQRAPVGPACPGQMSSVPASVPPEMLSRPTADPQRPG